MDILFNISQQLMLVKDLRGALDFTELENKLSSVVYKDNIEHKVSLEMQLLDDPVFDDSKKFIVTECELFLRHGMGLVDKFTNLKMTNSWANITNKDESHHEHKHPFSIVSGVLYLDNNPSNLNLHLEASMPQIPYFIEKNKSYASLRSLLKDQQVNLDDIENMKHHMVIFLSNTNHFVSKDDTMTTTRRSVAFNTFWDGMTGVAGEDLGSHTF